MPGADFLMKTSGRTIVVRLPSLAKELQARKEVHTCALLCVTKRKDRGMFAVGGGEAVALLLCRVCVRVCVTKWTKKEDSRKYQILGSNARRKHFVLSALSDSDDLVEERR